MASILHQTHRAVSLPLFLAVLILLPQLLHARQVQNEEPTLRRVLHHTPFHTSSILDWFKKDVGPEIDFVTVTSEPTTVTVSSSSLSSASSSIVSEMGMAPAPGPSGPSGPCPPVASECDFFFQGSPDAVPTFKVLSAKPDTPLSPPVLTSVESSIMTVGAVNTGDAKYICNGDMLPQDNQFYITGTKLQARTFNGNNTLALLNQYVKLMITSAQITAYGMTMNLNDGQANDQFPESRRCVVFKTMI